MNGEKTDLSDASRSDSRIDSPTGIGFVRLSERPPQVDLEQRILRNVVPVTAGLASDGWIIVPAGIDLDGFRANPIVTRRHLMQTGDAIVSDERPVVIGRALNPRLNSGELVTDVQFPDTDLGRDYAYLYGVNPAREVYMRAWSIEGPILERGAVNFEEARKLAGEYWDEITAERVRNRQTQVNVAVRFAMLAFAAVPAGADKHALTRAYRAGVATAGDIVARMDLQDAGALLAEVGAMMKNQEARMARLEQELKALRGEAASAAARGDSEAILREARALVDMARR